MLDFRFLVTSPAFEKTLSAGVDVAGVHKTDCAILASIGKEVQLSFHEVSVSRYKDHVFY